MDRNRDSSRRSSRDEAPARGRDREPSRGERGGREERSSSRYQYTGEHRSAENVEKRASQGSSDFDKIVRDGIKQFSPKKGDVRIRILPPTWPKPKHYGYDLFVHYGVGPDRGTYLDLDKMKDEPDPISEEYAALKQAGDADEEELRQLQSKKRVGVYLVDRDNEDEGVQFWAMPWGIDKDISLLSRDKSTGEVFNIDDPEEGYDIEFRKTGEGIKTKYEGVGIARRPSRLAAKFLDFAVDNPLPDVLQFFSYDEIAKAFGGGGAHKEKREERDEPSDRGSRSSARSKDDERDDDRDSARGSRDDDRGRSRGRVEESSSGDPELTYEAVQEMTSEELDALCESDDRLVEIDVDKASDDDELKEWICEDLKLKPAAKASTRRSTTRDPAPASDDDDGASLKLREMREKRGRR